MYNYHIEKILHLDEELVGKGVLDSPATTLDGCFFGGYNCDGFVRFFGGDSVVKYDQSSLITYSSESNVIVKNYLVEHLHKNF